VTYNVKLTWQIVSNSCSMRVNKHIRSLWTQQEPMLLVNKNCTQAVT